MLSLIGLPVFQTGSSGFLLVSSNLGALRGGVCSDTPKFDLGCEFLTGFSKLKAARLCKERKSCSGSWCLLVWALDHQALEDEFLEKRSEEGFSEGSESENCPVMHLDFRDNAQENSKVDEKNGEEEADGEDGRGGARVHVRAIARRLRFAKTADDVDKVMGNGGKFPLQVYSSIISAFGREEIRFRSGNRGMA